MSKRQVQPKPALPVSRFAFDEEQRRRLTSIIEASAQINCGPHLIRRLERAVGSGLWITANLRLPDARATRDAKRKVRSTVGAVSTAISELRSLYPSMTDVVAAPLQRLQQSIGAIVDSIVTIDAAEQRVRVDYSKIEQLTRDGSIRRLKTGTKAPLARKPVEVYTIDALRRAKLSRDTDIGCWVRVLREVVLPAAGLPIGRGLEKRAKEAAAYLDRAALRVVTNPDAWVLFD